MPLVQRANVILEVPEIRVQYYLDSGYSVIDEKGNVIKKSVIHDLPYLQKYYVDAEKRIAELEQEVADLKVKLEDAKKPVEKKKAKKD